VKPLADLVLTPFVALARTFSRRPRPSGKIKEKLRRGSGRSPSEFLVVRLCAAMGWEYEVIRIENGDTSFAECTATVACWVWPGRPRYGRSTINSFRQGEVAAVCSTYEWTQLGRYARERNVEDWIERVCRTWLDGMYGNYWYPMKRIMNYPQGGRFPASSDAELELWLAARGR